jgi:arsenate reductase
MFFIADIDTAFDIRFNKWSCTMKKIPVLFTCIHNSARSQMAEAFLKKFGGESFDVYSAGLEPGEINPLAVEVMKEAGIDISSNRTRSVFDLYINDKLFQYVIAVCDEAALQRCPLFPGFAKRLSWSLEDPASFQGTYKERLEKTRRVRDLIEKKVKEFMEFVQTTNK